MSQLRARVEKGRIVLDEPTSLPDGTVLDLVLDDGGDDLSDREREALHDAVGRSWQSLKAGRVKAVSAIVDELRAKR